MKEHLIKYRLVRIDAFGIVIAEYENKFDKPWVIKGYKP